MKNIKVPLIIIPVLCLLIMGMLMMCVEEESDFGLDFKETLPGSLHSTTAGMDKWYTQGTYNITGVPYEDLLCSECHADSCEDCHDVDSYGNPILGGKELSAATCYTCHSRQKTMQMKMISEMALYEEDVHQAAGLTCGDCHNDTQLHGDGNTYTSFLDAGYPRVQCETCHSGPNTPPSNNLHTTHAETNMDCSVCHMQSSLTCYSCHFNAEIEELGKAAYGPLSNFIMLVQDADGKITTGTFMAIVYDDAGVKKGVLDIAPYYAHNITADGRSNCQSCHSSANVQALKDLGPGEQMSLAWWDAGEGKVMNQTGVIPFTSIEDFTVEFVQPPLTNDPTNLVGDQCENYKCTYEGWAPVVVDEANLTRSAIANPLPQEAIDHLFAY